jgi:exopolysaccharide biosynthesis protein
VTTKFPTYDTGVNADYSYQSEELRIAIDKIEDDDLHQVYYVADIWIRNINAFRTGFGNGAYDHGIEDAKSFVAREHAILGVNGSANNGVLFHNGELVRKTVDSKYGAMVLYADGTMKAFNVQKDGFNLTKEMKKGIRHIWQFGPVLVQDGKNTLKAKSMIRHPRIMLGYYEPGHYVVVTVDGRTKKAIGMTEEEEAELMFSLGCQEAMNLDGGTSAVMVFMGQIISSPSNMGTGRAEGGRKLYDMVLFGEYDANGNAPALTDIPAEKYFMMDKTDAN